MSYGAAGRYQRRNAPARRRNARSASRGPLALALIALVTIGFFVMQHRGGSASGGVTSSGAPGAGTSPSAPASTSNIAGAATVTRGACLDSSGSVGPRFGEDLRADLAEAVDAMAPSSADIPTKAARDGQPVTRPRVGLDLTIRQVTTRSLSSDELRFTRHVTVPSVPGLHTSQPSQTQPHYLELEQAWQSDHETVAADTKHARAAALAGARDITGMPLAHERSGITACISALLETTSGGKRSYLLGSDLEESVPPQLTGSFHGAPLLIIQSCRSGDAAKCDRLLRTFDSRMRRLGAGRITAVRPEVAKSAISQWLRTGSVTG